jgi:hypothetical protein
MYTGRSQEVRMAIVDLVGLVQQRLDDIMEQNHSMTATELYFSDEKGIWSLITIKTSSGRVIEYDFIEGEEGWKRPDAVLEYSQAAMENVKVMVIVPDLALADVMIMVRNYDGQGIIVTDYSAAGLIPLPLAY